MLALNHLQLRWLENMRVRTRVLPVSSCIDKQSLNKGVSMQTKTGPLNRSQVCVSGSCRFGNNQLKTTISIWAMTSAQIRWNLSENNNLTACRMHPEKHQLSYLFPAAARGCVTNKKPFLNHLKPTPDKVLRSVKKKTKTNKRWPGLQKKTPHCFQGYSYNLSQHSSGRRPHAAFI